MYALRLAQNLHTDQFIKHLIAYKPLYRIDRIDIQQQVTQIISDLVGLVQSPVEQNRCLFQFAE